MGKDETSEPLSKKKGDKIMRKKIAALLAMLMLGGVLTGCGGGNKVATGGEDPNVVPEDTYEINWYMQGMPQEDVASVEAAVNDYLKDKINATLKMHRLESNQYSKQLNTMIAAVNILILHGQHPEFLLIRQMRETVHGLHLMITLTHIFQRQLSSLEK